MMNDENLIRAMAELWVENGGDSEGIFWSWSKIQKAVEEITNEKPQSVS